MHCRKLSARKLVEKISMLESVVPDNILKFK